ncbi:MAG: hypothetical protein AB4911_18035 [Oscillochloridaceae bacterium umkhey_bin13]
MTNIAAARLIFTDADPTESDPAAVGAVARTTVHGLQSSGEQITAVYTGEKGAADVFLWVLAASATVQTLIALPDFALKVAQLLTEVKKLRGTPTPSAPSTPTPPPITIIIQVGEAKATLRTDTAPADVALLTALLAETLPAQISIADVTAEVHVPPTPPNDI